MSKKLINLPENCVDEMLDGLVRAHPGLCLHAKNRVILTKQWPERENKVALICGGGSGHEPFAGGFVGLGMLNAAVAGSVFASPPTKNVLHAIRCLAQDNEAGTLVFIPNYTGDCLNFGLAVEWAKNEGLKVESIVLGDDCALIGKESSVGRRGMCGMVFVFKIAGAMAEKGKSLAKIAGTVRMVLENLATFGVSLSACSLPGSGPLFKIGDDEMELGLGVHGEAGIKRVKMCTAAETVTIILKSVIGTLKLKSGHDVAVFVNNLGGTSQLEQWLVTGEVHKQLTALGITVQRIYAGCIMTSLEMDGIQVCILKLSGTNEENWLHYLDAETKACAWPGSSMSVIPKKQFKNILPPKEKEEELKLQGPTLSPESCELIKRCLQAAAKALISKESRLNELDSACGDGDTGTTLRRMADDVLQQLENLPLSYPSTLLKQLSSIAESTMGGTSGALYSLLLTMAGTALEDESRGVTPKTWSAVWRACVDGTLHYSQAKLGDRSMFDAMLPALVAFENCMPLNKEEGISALALAVSAAEEGCQKTRNMKARVGRASYVDASYVTDVDAGAYGVTVWLEAIFNELRK